MPSMFVIRLYEVLGAGLFLGGLWWVVRSRQPLYYGAYLGASIGGGVFEWIFDSRYYFRLTADSRFLAAWTIDGVESPAAMILFYAFFFGIPLLLVLQHHDAIVGRLGVRGLYGALATAGVVGTPLFECTNTSIAEIYTYHQRDGYLLWGMPWSNMWFGALMFVCAYWALLRARELAATPAGASTPVAVALGGAAIVTGFFVAATLNGVWYAIAQPWTATPRPF
jgi:hypothetical protein